MEAKRTFKDFFTNSLVVDHVRKSSQLKNIFEMAIRHDVAKLPANIDHDDIQFLRQFPHHFWAAALQKRYEMLHNAVTKLHGQRREIGFEELKSNLKNLMSNMRQMAQSSDNPNDIKQRVFQNWAEQPKTAKAQFSDGEIQRLISDLLKNRKILKLSPNQIDTEADKLAHEKTKSHIENVEDPEEAHFTFKATDIDQDSGKVSASNRTKETKTYVAKPFLNRLYHKLERTRGIPHTPESGLEGVGKYGYDMAEPVASTDEDHPNITSGMKFPSKYQIRDRIRDFSNANQHHIFGNLPPESDKIQYFPTQYNDRWSTQYLIKKYEKQFEAQLRMTGQYEKENELRRDAAKMAKEKVIQMAEQGQLKGPPIPGKHPEGLPIGVKKGKNGEVSFDAPKLWLPHEKKILKVKKPDGTVENEEKWIPIVNPAKFFRELGSADEDYETDAEGRKVYDPATGFPKFKVPEDQRFGHDKQFVHVPDEQFADQGVQGKGIQAKGALDFNHNSEGRMHITRGDPNYEEAYQKVFPGDPPQKLVDFDSRSGKLVPAQGTGMYEDFALGVLFCGKSGCGGGTGHEIAILLQNFDLFYDMAIQSALQDLRNPALYFKKGRVNYAKSITSIWMQKDQGRGGGTRRLRALSQNARHVSMDTTTTGSEGGELGIGDTIAGQVADKSKTGGVGGPIHIDRKRTKGEKKLDTSGFNRPYSLDELRVVMAELEKTAQKADSTAERAQSVARQMDASVKASNSIENMISSSLEDRAAVIIQLGDILTNLYKNDPHTQGNPEDLAKKQIQGLVENGADTSEKLIDLFKTLDVVKNAMGMAAQQNQGQGQIQPAAQDAPKSPLEQRAIDTLNSSLGSLRSKGIDLDNPQVKQAITSGAFANQVIDNMVDITDDEKQPLVKVVQDELNKMIGIAPKIAKPEQKPIAARQIQQQEPDIMPLDRQGRTIPEVMTKFKDDKIKKALALAFHPDWHNTNSNNLNSILNFLNANKDKIDPKMYSSAVHHLNNSINRLKLGENEPI